MAELHTVGPIPRTMAQVEAENRHLKQMLVVAWRNWQDSGAYLIQQGQSLERAGVEMAGWLEQLGVPVDANMLDV